MQRNPRRGHRPLATVLLSERRIGGVREFVFSSTPQTPDASSHPRGPLRALMTVRAFAWAEDVPAANDPGVAERGAGAVAEERDFREFLLAVRQVYRSPRRRT